MSKQKKRAKKRKVCLGKRVTGKKAIGRNGSRVNVLTVLQEEYISLNLHDKKLARIIGLE